MTKEAPFHLSCSNFYENLNKSDSDDDPFSLLTSDMDNFLDIDNELALNSDSYSPKHVNSPSFGRIVQRNDRNPETIVENFLHCIKSNLQKNRTALQPNKLGKLNLREVAARVIQHYWFGYVDRLIFEYTRKLLDHCTNNPVATIKSTNPQETRLLDYVSRTFIRFRLSGKEFPPKIVYNLYTNRPIINIGDSLTIHLSDETKKTSKDVSNYKKCTEQTKHCEGQTCATDWKTCIDVEKKLMTLISRKNLKNNNLKRTVSSRTVRENKLINSSSSTSMPISRREFRENSKRKSNKNRSQSNSRKLNWITDIINNYSEQADQQDCDISPQNFILDVPMSVSFSGSTIQSSATSVPDNLRNIRPNIDSNLSLVDDKDKIYCNYAYNDYFQMTNLDFLHLLED